MLLVMQHRMIYMMQIIFLKLHVHIKLTSAPLTFMYVPLIHTQVLHGSTFNELLMQVNILERCSCPLCFYAYLSLHHGAQRNNPIAYFFFIYFTR